MSKQPHIFDLSRDELRELFQQRDMPAFRADQVLDWVYRKHVADPHRMLNLSKADRARLSEGLRFESSELVQHQVATDGVQKLLLQWRRDEDAGSHGQTKSAELARVISTPAPNTDTAADNLTHGTQTGSAGASLYLLDPRRQTECVMIPVDELEEEHTKSRRTACISSQVGCAVGCRFCASGLGGLDRDLTAGQIVEQVWRLGTLEGVGRISHVVFMGMGEPLANFAQVTRAIQLITSDWGLGISARRITISTVGLPSQMRRLAELELPVTLAISLHAPNDPLRRQLIPWAEYVTIEQLLEAGQHYFDRTGREITLEYILLGGVNDQAEHAKELSHVATTLRANVNLIRYNEVKGLPFDRPRTEDVRAFQTILRKAGVNTHIRASRGRDIAAACGQLRHENRASTQG